MRDFPYPRWMKVKLNPIEQLQYLVNRPFWVVKQKWHQLWYSRLFFRYVGKPLHDRKFSPWVPFSSDAKAPVMKGTDADGCRTKHGKATLYWNCWREEPRPQEARKALLPDGTRGDVQRRIPGWWRRKARKIGDGDKVWIIGEIEIRPDDIVFHDAASQDLGYQPPPADSEFQLERALALCPEFIAALADDKFAIVAHEMLQNMDWMSIGSRKVGAIDSVHYFIAASRNKGEDYCDYKLGNRPELTPSEVAILWRDMHDIMRSLGWRTYAPAELSAMARGALRSRVELRVEGWRRMDLYEARLENTAEVIEQKLAVVDMPMFEGDDEAWLEELTEEERVAASKQFTLRLKGLAASGRISREEYEELFGMLCGRSWPAGLAPP